MSMDNFKGNQPSKINLLKAFGKLDKNIFHPFILALTSFERDVEVHKTITGKIPSGKFTAEHIKVCQLIYDGAHNRTEKLEGKAGVLIASISILIPITLSFGVYIYKATEVSHGNDSNLSLLMLTALLFSIICLSCGFFTAFKASSVRKIQRLYLGSVIDVDNKKVVDYTDDHFARGLLWCAIAIEAINEHLAGLLIATQKLVFYALSMFMIAVALAFSTSTLKGISETQKSGHQITDIQPEKTSDEKSIAEKFKKTQKNLDASEEKPR